MSLRYPEMRQELLGYLEDLSDKPKIARGSESGSLLDYAVHFLFDDTVLAERPEDAVGWLLRDKAEAAAVQKLTSAIAAVFDRYGTDQSDAEYAACPEWDAVVGAARAARECLLGDAQ